MPSVQLTEQKPEADSAELPAFLDDKLIMAIISNKDDGLKYKKQQIELYFSIHPEEAERAEYVPFGTGTTGNLRKGIAVLLWLDSNNNNPYTSPESPL